MKVAGKVYKLLLNKDGKMTIQEIPPGMFSPFGSIPPMVESGTISSINPDEIHYQHQTNATVKL